MFYCVILAKTMNFCSIIKDVFHHGHSSCNFVNLKNLLKLDLDKLPGLFLVDSYISVIVVPFYKELCFQFWWNFKYLAGWRWSKLLNYWILMVMEESIVKKGCYEVLISKVYSAISWFLCKCWNIAKFRQCFTFPLSYL